jgi:hypothetical protein
LSDAFDFSGAAASSLPIVPLPGASLSPLAASARNALSHPASRPAALVPARTIGSDVPLSLFLHLGPDRAPLDGDGAPMSALTATVQQTR